MKLWMSFVVFACLSSSALACNEACRKAQAEAQHNIKFPGYLTEKYCDGLKSDFMNREMKSLERYRNTQLASMHRGGMNNINQFLQQRQEWLKECDTYISYTSNGRLFNDDETTDKVFAAITSVSDELTSLIKGVTYGSADAQTQVAESKFDQLIQLVDDHQTLMLIKGKMVVR